ncbi:Glycine cleavage system H protein [Phytophthora cinnamomi]|uniref:Glycine cleavage system H protein n=1 Tax=Phytophthora cinnamomi TaxID=4785 RepID=UPI003559A76C|nr:Glycine cleavage system H protein [Phytophthora cinnamomi]
MIFAEPSRASAIILTIMDKFGVYLAFHAGSKGQYLSRHSVAQYYRQVKCWLLDKYPVPGGAVARKLLSMGRTLEQQCIKRESGSFVKKAVACTKTDLQKMEGYLYSTASCAEDYQHAALLCLLWYLFGRASDLTFVRKQQLPIGAGGVFFIRFIRIKTSDEQALSLFPDADFRSCPLLALALALASQEAPSTALLSHLPALTAHVPVELTVSVPLLEMLEGCDDQTPSSAPAQSNSSRAPSPLGIHAQVNRLLDRVAGPAGVEEPLSSHSFCRGGAQHANACSDLTAQWIFDRGAWNMTTTNKAFAYVFNTPKEDHQVAKVLSDMAPKQTSVLPTLEAFDSTTQDQIHEVSHKIFSASHSLGNPAFNISAAVREVLTATLILHYPSLLTINPRGDPRDWRCLRAATTKQLVAFLKLFIEDGYVLDESSPSYKDDVRQLGELASGKVMAFLRLRNASAAPKTTAKTRLNGWYKCSDYTFSDEGSSSGHDSECATFNAPLCYPGICETPQFADRMIDIFVKRMVATNAAQATTTGSPSGRDIDLSEVPACAQELENEYGSLASFSTTSAATDLVSFISKYTNGASTIVYGTSYGTVLVERLIHLNPPYVTGYVLDGIATSSGSSADKFMSASFNNAVHGVVMSTQLDSSEGWTPTCGTKILASFVTNKGSLKGLDKSCIEGMPAFNLTVPIEYQAGYFSTDDVYDGALNSSLSYSE